jgi:hypothetical protein
MFPISLVVYFTFFFHFIDFFIFVFVFGWLEILFSLVTATQQHLSYNRMFSPTHSVRTKCSKGPLMEARGGSWMESGVNVTLIEVLDHQGPRMIGGSSRV